MKTRLRIVVVRKDSEVVEKLKEYLWDMGIDYEILLARTDNDAMLIGFEANRMDYDYLERVCDLKGEIIFY